MKNKKKQKRFFLDWNIKINGERANKNEKENRKKRVLSIEISKLIGGERTERKKKNKRDFFDWTIKINGGRANKNENFHEHKKEKQKIFKKRKYKNGGLSIEILKLTEAERIKMKNKNKK